MFGELYYMSNPVTKYVIRIERFIAKSMFTPLASGLFISNNIQYKTETFPLSLEFPNKIWLVLSYTSGQRIHI